MNELRMTADGSGTLFSGQFSETYHSVNGAITESDHVFIRAGLGWCKKREIGLFEVGFGTGLNALLASRDALAHGNRIRYHAIEKYPVGLEEIGPLPLPGIGDSEKEFFMSMHRADWDAEIPLSPWFSLKKMKGSFEECVLAEMYDVVFFDAFSPATQPELWTVSVFDKIFTALAQGGILTTYCAKGEVRRSMQAAGFQVERLPGPPGKREMLRGIKQDSLCSA